MKKAVVLLAGGIDSTTTLAIAKQQGYECYAISFDYAQSHRSELDAAKIIAKKFGVVEHKIMPLDLSMLTTSALTNHELDVPDYTGAEKVTSSYVPARNTIFLSYALAWAEVLEAHDIFYGGCLADDAGFPDCRPEYVAAYEKMATLATALGTDVAPMRIHAPVINKTKAQTLLLGTEMGIDYRLTVTCYAANTAGEACGKCESCVGRKKGFSEAKLADVTRYVDSI
jgi:7-cyano-7-deazaguanine synthase